MFRILLAGIVLDLVLFLGTIPIGRIHYFFYPDTVVPLPHLRFIYFGAALYELGVVQQKVVSQGHNYEKLKNRG